MCFGRPEGAVFCGTVECCTVGILTSSENRACGAGSGGKRGKE